MASAGATEGDGSPVGAAGDAEIHAATAKYIVKYSVARKLRYGRARKSRWRGSKRANPTLEFPPPLLSRREMTEPRW